MRKAYQSDLSDAEWSCLEPHLPSPEVTGRPRLHGLHEILDAIFYVLKRGCAWRLLPHDFPTAGSPSTTTSVSGVNTLSSRDPPSREIDSRPVWERHKDRCAKHEPTNDPHVCEAPEMRTRRWA